MSKHVTALASLVLAIAYSVGVMVTLLVLFVFGEGLRSTWMRPSTMVEQLKIRLDGEPVIMSYPAYDYNDQQFRTIDGRTLGQGAELHWCNLNYIPAPGQMPVPTAPAWTCRMIGFNDLHDPAGFWYFVYESEFKDRGYFVGIDSKSKLPIGFIGKQGFSATAPPRNDQFVIDLESFGLGTYGGIVAFAPACGKVPSQLDLFSPYPSLRFVYLVSEGSLLKVNLYNRTVETLLESDQLVSLAKLQQDKSVSTDLPVSVVTGRSVTLQDDTDLPVPTITSKLLLAIRFSDHIELFDPAGENIRETTSYPLPEEQLVFDDQRRLPPRLWLYVTEDGTLIYRWNTSEPPDSGRAYRLVWVQPDGQATRTEDIRFAGSSSNTQAAFVTAVAPTGGTFFPMIVLIGSASMYLAEGDATNLIDALSQGLAIGWPALVSAFVASCLAVWLCFRRQQRFGIERGSWWLLFVALFGLPGLLGYIWSRRWPPLVACAECGRPASQDRPSCHQCGEEFAHPPLLGTEVFA